MRKAFFAIFQRDLRSLLRNRSGPSLALGFALLVIVLLSFGIGPDSSLLQRLAPGLSWVVLLLASLLTLESLFSEDREDGSLDLLILGSLPLEFAVIAKVLAYWCTTGVPLALATPVFGIFLNLDPALFFPLTVSMLVGTLALGFLGSVGAALALSLHRGGLLTGILVLPFYIPVLIFGVCVPEKSSFLGFFLGVPFLLLLVLTCMVTVLAPFAAAAALRTALQ